MLRIVSVNGIRISQQEVVADNKPTNKKILATVVLILIHRCRVAKPADFDLSHMSLCLAAALSFDQLLGGQNTYYTVNAYEYIRRL
jgi:hypothetical protein